MTRHGPDRWSPRIPRWNSPSRTTARNLAGRVPDRAPRRGGAALRGRGGRRRGRRRAHPPGRSWAAPVAGVPGLPGERAAADPDRSRAGADPRWQEGLTRTLLRARPVYDDPACGDPGQDWPGIFEEMLGAPVVLRSDRADRGRPARIPPDTCARPRPKNTRPVRDAVARNTAGVGRGRIARLKACLELNRPAILASAVYQAVPNRLCRSNAGLARRHLSRDASGRDLHDHSDHPAPLHGRHYRAVRHRHDRVRGLHVGHRRGAAADGRERGRGQQPGPRRLRHARPDPPRPYLACADGNAYLGGLHWAAWGSSAAFAGGTSTFNDCVPSCVAGHGHSFPALVALWRPEPRPGHEASATSPA